MLQLTQQPPLLQGTRRRCVAHLPLQDQRLTLAHLPDHGVDRVRAQSTQRFQAAMPIDDHIALRRVTIRDHHDRLLLTVLLDRDQQLTLTLRAASAQMRVADFQLVKLQFHRQLHRQGMPLADE